MAQAQSLTQQIVVVEDNPLISEIIATHLTAAGFETVTAESGERALEILPDTHPALIVLDVVLGGIDGFEVCRRIRQGAFTELAPLANVPVLMLTALAEKADKMDGFDAGVDDYLVKPFDPDELIARVRAIIRRTTGASPSMIQVGKLLIDPGQRSATVEGQPLDLAPKEFDLLHLLASHPGQAFPRANLLELVWGYSSDINTRTVDVHVQRLREKLSAYPDCAHMIVTEWGVGYKLVA